MVIRDKRVGYMSTVSAGDKQEAGEAGVGGASMKCGDSRLDEGRRWWRRGVGGAIDAIGPFSLILTSPL